MGGKGIGDAVGFAFILCAIISAAVGWGVIEGIIWLFKHISITLI